VGESDRLLRIGLDLTILLWCGLRCVVSSSASCVIGEKSPPSLASFADAPADPARRIMLSRIPGKSSYAILMIVQIASFS